MKRKILLVLAIMSLLACVFAITAFADGIVATLYKNGNKILPVRKISHNQGQYKVHLYDKNEIDYFVGVDIDTENLYIVPIDFISKYKSSISLKTLEPYKNNFSQLEPYSENIIV